MNQNDCLLIGVDLVKDPLMIHESYIGNPYEKDFIVNILQRANRELKTDFVIENFTAYCHYDPIDTFVHSQT